MPISNECVSEGRHNVAFCWEVCIQLWDGECGRGCGACYLSICCGYSYLFSSSVHFFIWRVWRYVHVCYT